eukprot:scaffold2736_cov94-Isochrysis_galbana.AAC.3
MNHRLPGRLPRRHPPHAFPLLLPRSRLRSSRRCLRRFLRSRRRTPRTRSRPRSPSAAASPPQDSPAPARAPGPPSSPAQPPANPPQTQTPARRPRRRPPAPARRHHAQPLSTASRPSSYGAAWAGLLQPSPASGPCRRLLPRAREEGGEAPLPPPAARSLPLVSPLPRALLSPAAPEQTAPPPMPRGEPRTPRH